jgi:two-component system chemotaxis response regulator CheY
MTAAPSKRILLVDDDSFMRSTIKRMLRVIGYGDVSEAGDGSTALSMVEECRPDLIICDIEMAPMRGLEFVEKLRRAEEPALRDTPVIMLTGDVNEATVRNAVKLGIRGYLAKPVSPKQLGARVAAVLG